MSYAIQVERVTATIVDQQGHSHEVTVFLHTVSPHRFSAETIADRLNDPETSFLPCELDGRSELIRLGSISYVELAGGTPEVERLEEIGACHAPVELDLDCGEALVGELVYEAPANMERVSDLLNVRPSRFLLLRIADRTVFVRRNAITWVRF